MDVKKVHWFTTGSGTIGIVQIENAVGQKKAYIGIGQGRDEKIDAQMICDYGAKLTLSQAREITDHLNNPEIK